MYDVNTHHKTIMEYARFINKNNIINSCFKHNDYIDDGKYKDLIRKELPKLHNIQNHTSKMELMKNLQELNCNSQHQEWGESSRTRG